MPEDYAHKEAPRAPKGPKPVPWVLITLCTVMIITVFTTLLYINRTGKNPLSPEQEVADPIKPPPKSSQWDYVDNLRNRKIEVEVPEQPKPKLMEMQCGSFRKLAQADQMKATIAFQGISSSIRRTDQDSGTWYRVILGPYEGKRAAERDRNSLERVNIRTCMIWGYQGHRG